MSLNASFSCSPRITGRDRHAAAEAEGAGGDFETLGGLLAFVFAGLHLANHVRDDPLVETRRDDLGGALQTHFVPLQNLIEHLATGFTGWRWKPDSEPGSCAGWHGRTSIYYASRKR